MYIHVLKTVRRRKTKFSCKYHPTLTSMTIWNSEKTPGTTKRVPSPPDLVVPWNNPTTRRTCRSAHPLPMTTYRTLFPRIAMRKVLIATHQQNSKTPPVITNIRITQVGRSAHPSRKSFVFTGWIFGRNSVGLFLQVPRRDLRPHPPLVTTRWADTIRR